MQINQTTPSILRLDSAPVIRDMMFVYLRNSYSAIATVVYDHDDL